ncbi:GAP family protein [Leifsonia sp. fls2-241-R2A-40a]|uniref:GAP family protein n=1 Tax=Leifsonia sp. fls2-241-R2A-40a TaxID=3040290 RepID=UPI00254A7E1A|nr:GAP family protein [Leifsonia sp. fls2-241-R2A-40a]
MGDALGYVIPLAFAGLLSSVPLTATIVILLSPNQRRSSLPFVIGWTAGIFLTAALFSLLAQVLPLTENRQPEAAVGIVEILIGVALIVLAIVQWRRRPAVPSTAEPRWLRAVRSFGPWSSLGFALALCFRPKAILLSVAAGLAIRGANLSVSEAVVVIAVYTLITASGVIALVVVALASPRRTRPRLERAREWIASNSAAVTVVVLALVGVFVLGSGIAHLT